MADDLSEQETVEQAFRRAGIGRGDRVVLMDVGAAQIYDFYARAARNVGATQVVYLHLTRDLDAALGALNRLRPSVLLTIPSLLVRAAGELDRFWPESEMSLAMPDLGRRSHARIAPSRGEAGLGGVA